MPDVAADQREGVDRVVLHDEELDGTARRVGGPQQAVAQGLHVVGDLRVVDERRVDAHLAHDAVADGALLLVRQDRVRGIAEVGQHLRLRRQQGGADGQGDEAADHHREAGRGSGRKMKSWILGTRGDGIGSPHPERLIMNEKLTHFDEGGQAWMVDVGAKDETARRAVAAGSDPHAPGDARARPLGHREEGRRAGRRAHRGDPGRQAHLGADPALPPDRAHRAGGPFRRRRERARRSPAAPWRSAAAARASRWRPSPP